MNDVDAVLEEAIINAFACATAIAVVRHEKKWVKKSKIPSDKNQAILEWLGSKHGKVAVRRVLQVAMLEAQSQNPKSIIDACRYLLALLGATYRDETKRRGRPSQLIPGGLLAQAKKPKRKSSGRPREVSLEGEKRMMDWVYGQSLRLWVSDNNLPKSVTAEQAIDRLYKHNKGIAPLMSYMPKAVKEFIEAGRSPNCSSVRALQERARRSSIEAPRQLRNRSGG